MKLYTGPISLFGFKVEMAALEKGIPLDIELVPFSPIEGYEPRHPEVLRVNPKRQVPVLVDQGLELFDSSLILEFFEDLRPAPALWPATPRARAEARKAELFLDEVLFPAMAPLYPAIRPHRPKAEIKGAIDTLRNYFQTMDHKLADGRQHLLGELSFVDITCLVMLFGASFLGARPEAGLLQLVNWRNRMLIRPSAAPLRRGLSYLESLGSPLDWPVS